MIILRTITNICVYFVCRESNMIVVTLGNFSIQSTNRSSKKISLVHLASVEKERENVLKMMRSSSYDHFSVQLKDIQVS